MQKAYLFADRGPLLENSIQKQFAVSLPSTRLPLTTSPFPPPSHSFCHSRNSLGSGEKDIREFTSVPLGGQGGQVASWFLPEEMLTQAGRQPTQQRFPVLVLGLNSDGKNSYSPNHLQTSCEINGKDYLDPRDHWENSVKHGRDT